MRDLAGGMDSDDGFAEVEVLTEQHLRETAERAVRTRRGTLREYQDRYVDLAGFLYKQASTFAAAVAANGLQEDLEEDPRIDRATVVFSPANADGRVPFRIELKASPGSLPIVVEGT